MNSFTHPNSLHQYLLTEQDINDFRVKGFLHLKSFYPDDFIKSVMNKIDSQISKPTDRYQSGFNRLAFDLFDKDPLVSDLLSQPWFKSFMQQITGLKMVFAQAIAFELQKNIDKGFPWHIGTQSFGYHRADDYGCTIWAPLAPIKTDKQRGGMAYVPKNIVSGEFMYTHVDPAVFSCLHQRLEKQDGISTADFIEMRDGPLNDTAMKKILDYFAVEDDFEIGDALIFDKNVIHRSVMLDEGDINSRTAYVMRFFSDASRYDKQRAENLEIPRTAWNYAGPTRFHLEVAKQDGDLLAESDFFKGREFSFL